MSRWAAALTAALACCCILTAQSPPAAAQDQGITRSQANEILVELRQIRELLQQQLQPTGAKPGRAVAPRGPVPATLRIRSEWPALGSPNAQVVMVEFVDLQCGFCRAFQADTFPQIQSQFIDKGLIRFLSADLPEPSHEFAVPAAEAAHCAGEQGHFWEFRSALLASTAPPSPPMLTQAAARLGLDVAKFAQCASAASFQSQISDSQSVALTAGVRGTPGFIVGRLRGDQLVGERIAGAQPFAAFKSAILAALASKTTGTPDH